MGYCNDNSYWKFQDEAGNITIAQITIQDDTVALGQLQVEFEGGDCCCVPICFTNAKAATVVRDVRRSLWPVIPAAALAVIILLLLLLWRNVAVQVWARDEQGGEELLRTVRRLRRRRDKVIVTVTEDQIRGGASWPGPSPA